jgi:endonuclease YncB( thermonuclease family)
LCIFFARKYVARKDALQRLVRSSSSPTRAVTIFVMKIQLAILLATLVIASVADAYTLSGRVVGIADGDTLTVLDSGKTQHVIRLSGIDAPESSQAFGQRSKQSLSRMVFGHDVSLDWGEKTSYNRLICKVILPGGDDVCLDQIKAEMAWHYKHYQNEQPPADRVSYAAAEDTARLAHLGSWADAHPIAPYDYRHGTQSELVFDANGHRVESQSFAPAVTVVTGHVRGNADSHIYQWPGCPAYDAISEHNRVDFVSAAAAQQAGYRAARNCP